MLKGFESFNDGRFNLVDTLYDSNYTTPKNIIKSNLTNYLDIETEHTSNIKKFEWLLQLFRIK